MIELYALGIGVMILLAMMSSHEVTDLLAQLDACPEPDCAQCARILEALDE